jgi:HTH-type transcriptional regulator/antitoxin HigA
MEKLKYTVIKSDDQYFRYCKILEELVFQDDDNLEDEIELLELLIHKWDEEHNNFEEVNPIELLESLMEDHEMKAKDLAEILGLSKGTVSKILNYQKGLSKESIRKLSMRFKMRQEAFNRPYPLVGKLSKGLKSAS